MLQNCIFSYAHKIKKSRNGAGLELVVPVSDNTFEFKKKQNPKSPSKRVTLKDLFLRETDEGPVGYSDRKDPYEDPHSEPYLLQRIRSCKSIEEPVRYVKKRTLGEILKAVTLKEGRLSNSVYTELFLMIKINLCSRGFPAPRPKGFQNEDTDDSFSDPHWPSLEVIYRILLSLVTFNDPRILAKDPRWMHKPLILVILDCFQSDDRREREAVKAVFHRIYEKFIFFRSFMRNSVKNVLFRVVYEGADDHPGLPEILEFVGSVINGMALPIKEEHKAFLKNVLIPLHRPRTFPAYHLQLQTCICQFLQKDEKLADAVVRALLKFWPVTNCQKEILLLEEIEEVLGLVDDTEFRKFVGPLSVRLCKCFTSNHLQVAEKALNMWNNQHFVNLVSQQMKQTVPLMVEAMERNIQTHWSRSIREQSQNLKKVLEEIDPDLYQESLLRWQEKESQAEHVRRKRDILWEKLEEMAQENTH